ncbi:hypothetical protein G9A89_019766 [Geosiphon pyriformis]|nr:hypothetical protein G9A89_019766 [Geosiphon pyriformis]
MLTWKQPPAQNPAKSISSLMKGTAILQPIGLSNKKKQPALASEKHSNMWTPIPLNVTNNTSPINWIMAYQDITKLEKFSEKKNNMYLWIAKAKKAITVNNWDNDRAIQMQTNSRLSRPIPHNPAQFQPAPTGYLNQAFYLDLMKDQGFDKSISVKKRDIKQISQPFKQTKSNILPATITEDTILAAIFSFDINNLNTHSLFSGAAINQNKPIMVLYTDIRVGGIDIKLILNNRSASSIITKQLMNQLGCQVDCVATTWIIIVDGNTKTPIGKIDNFSFEINGIQISTKVLVIEATQYQALVENNWLSKANTILN